MLHNACVYSALQRELSEIHAKLANAQAELHTLKTYKDKEYPVKVLIITNIKREIEKLEETQQVTGSVCRAGPLGSGWTSLCFIEGSVCEVFNINMNV